MKRLVLLACTATALGVFGGASESALWPTERKKVVYLGRDINSVGAADLLRNADAIKRSGIDGIGMVLGINDASGKSIGNSAYVLDSTSKWTREMVSGPMSRFKKVLAHTGMRESFMWTISVPRKPLDWKDDARWECIAHNMGVLGWFIRESGLRGIYVDPEDYTKREWFFRHPGDKATWEEMAVLARKRARQMFTPMFRENPDTVVLGFWLFSIKPRQSQSHDQMASARADNDLWPSFINGILDAIPEESGVRLIDGNENGYHYDALDNEFAISLAGQWDAERGLVAPENRAKFRRCFRPGFGVYLPSYANEKGVDSGKYYYFAPYKGSRLGALERNLAEMVRYTGEYVWIWDDTRTWIKWDAETKLPTGKWGVSRESYGDKLPGLYSIVRACFNPKEFLRVDAPELRNSGRMTNLVEGIDFLQKSRVALYGPTGKKEAGEKGKGHLFHEIPNVKPGSHYVIAAEGVGESICICAAWRRTLPKERFRWHAWSDPGPMIPMKPIGGRRMRGADVIAVPEGADGLTFWVDLKPEPGQECYLDKVFIGEVPVK